jgi:molybdenum cofactor biosynthesis enzyme MoaA
VRDALEARWTLTPSEHRSGGPARYVDVAETGGRLGFITPLTNKFCASCNRIRVTATGELYACLGGAEKVDLRAALRSTHPTPTSPQRSTRRCGSSPSGTISGSSAAPARRNRATCRSPAADGWR